MQCALDPTGQRLRISVDHRTPAVSAEDARRFLACFVHAARAAAGDVNARVHADRLPPQEVALLRRHGHGPRRERPRQLSLACVVDRHATHRPAAVAVQDRTESYTYAQLSQLSQHLAERIRRAASAPHPVVAVMAERSARYWAAVLGIWRAGGTYVPLAPHLPTPRLQQMIAQARVDLFMVDPRESGVGDLLPPGLALVAVDNEPNGPRPPVPQYPLAECAYALFTSGSTGRPKGARVSAAAMVNHWWSKVELLDMDEHSVVAQSAPASFDVSLWQFAAPWLRGGRVVVIDDDTLLDPVGLFAEMDSCGVQVFETVPSHLAALVDAIDCGAGACQDF